MNLTRLMVLGCLSERGPLHGHQIRRVAEFTNVVEWAGISVGALYRELRTLEAEGLVEAIRTERVGRRPTRTVYSITDEGRLELSILHERAFDHRLPHQDPMGVALLFGASVDRERTAALLNARRRYLALGAEHLAEERRLVERVNPVGAAVIRRGELHLRAELAWHEECDDIIIDQPSGESTQLQGSADSTTGATTDQALEAE